MLRGLHENPARRSPDKALGGFHATTDRIEEDEQ